MASTVRVSLSLISTTVPALAPNESCPRPSRGSVLPSVGLEVAEVGLAAAAGSADCFTETINVPIGSRYVQV